MAYDQKSNIGQFNASQGQDQTGQIDVYRQQLSGIQLGQTNQSSIQLGQTNQSSIQLSQISQSSVQLGQIDQSSVQLGQINQSSMQLGQINQSSMQLGQISQNSIQLGQINQSSMQLGRDVIKTIDLLDMDQFGRNSSLLRKNLSIVDAVQTNTDKEYGVIQIEDGLEFDSASAEPITDNHVEDFTKRWLCSTIKKGQKEASSVTYWNTGTLYVIPNIFYRDANSDFASIQWIGHEYSLAKIGTENIASASGSYGSIGGTSGGEVLFEQGFESNTQIEKLRFIISNNSTVNMHIAFKIWQGYGSRLISVTKTISPSTTLDFIAYDNDIDIGHIFDSSATDGPGYIPSYPIGVNRIDVDFTNGTPTYGQSYIIVDNRDSSGDYDLERVGWVVPKGQLGWDECSIRMMIYREHEYSSPQNDYTFIMDKAAIGVTTLYVDLNELTNVIDFESRSVVYAEKKEIASQIYIQELKTIATTDKGNIYFQCPSVANAYYYKTSNEPVDYFALTEYYKLYDIEEKMSFGLARRSGDKYSICIKKGDRFYTATGGDVMKLTKYNTIKSFSIVNISSESFSFVIKTTDELTFYGLFRNVLSFTGGMLYNQAWHSVCFFDCYQVIDRKIANVNNDLYTVGISGSSIETYSISQVSSNNDLYHEYPGAISAALPVEPMKIVLTNKTMLGSSAMRLVGSGDYILAGLSFPMSLCLQHELGSSLGNQPLLGRREVCVYSVPTVSKIETTVGGVTTTTYSFNSLPPRTVDEYPAVFYNSPIGDKSFTIGKTRHVSIGGTVYASSGMALCGDPSQLLLSETGDIYSVAGLFFVSNRVENLTKIYSYSELGLVLNNTVEDAIICDPVRSSVGLIMCGSTGIWSMSDNGVRKLFTVADISKASLKTTLDNSVIAVLDIASEDTIYLLKTNENYYLKTTDGDWLSTTKRKFQAVTINQLGNVSHQMIGTELNTAAFIDIGSSSKLLIIDLVDNGTVNFLEKELDNSSTHYEISSNQNVEMYGEPVVGELYSVELFAQGTGTIQLFINGVSKETLAINSTGRYGSYKFRINSEMSMLDYKFKISKNVKILQRIIGTVIMRENYNG